ncbi:MAG: NAD-dependent epimerase/dehydratase family protein, partial [Desulfopila sp.]
MKKVVVTGGGGFVGQAIVRQALADGAEVKVIGRNRYRALEALGVQCLVGDIRDLACIETAVSGADTVFHVAALAGIWGSWSSYESINVQGTANVLTACRNGGVPALVYTSTPSVVFAGDSIGGGDESLPYSANVLCNYARSKIMAEREVLAANDQTLATCAIRPHLVWGPKDPHLVPRLLDQGRKGKLVRVGSGDNL